MTSKGAGNGRAKAEAGSSAALLNDKQRAGNGERQHLGDGVTDKV